jgi:CubicO group peptidase (beta-lactamase class C family)
VKAVTIAATIVLAGCHASPRSPAPVSGLAPAVDAIMSAYADPTAPGASVLIVRDGRTLLARSYGMADIEAGITATPRTNYRLASLTKQFTATAIMLLKEAGRLRYDDPITTFLPELPAAARGITIRMLLTHTSGLWAYEDFVPDSQTTQVHDADVPALIARAESTYFPPGSAYRYSNTGYSLLALIVERASGQRFAQFLHDRIFAPLGMNGTVAYENGISTVANRAYGYTITDRHARRTDQSSTSAVLGDGGIYTSLEDLAKWDAALDAHALVAEGDQREAWTSALTTRGARVGYGFGWFVDSASDGPRLRHHGETMGFTNAILKIPSRRLTIVILTNRTGGEPWDLATRIAALPALR